MDAYKILLTLYRAGLEPDILEFNIFAVPFDDEVHDAVIVAHHEKCYIILGIDAFAVYFDYPGLMEFDIGFTAQNILKVSAEKNSLNVFIITPENAETQYKSENSHRLTSLVHQFRNLTGQSYIPPKWAFGFMQSRWGYKNQNDIDTVIQNHKKNSSKTNISSI